MTFQDALLQIPIMFYATVVLLPTFIVIYFVAGRKKKVVPLRSADPALVLRAQGVNVRRALTSNMLPSRSWIIMASEALLKRV